MSSHLCLGKVLGNRVHISLCNFPLETSVWFSLLTLPFVLVEKDQVLLLVQNHLVSIKDKNTEIYKNIVLTRVFYFSAFPGNVFLRAE